MQAAGPAHMRGMIPLSVLDLSPIPEGSDAGLALRHSRDLARHVDTHGYRRFWMAEHHNMPSRLLMADVRSPQTCSRPGH